VGTLKKAVAEIHHADNEVTKAELSRVLRLETMLKVRETCDAAEAVCPADLWTLATYKELLVSRFFWSLFFELCFKTKL
jgi:glutamine synthetase